MKNFYIITNLKKDPDLAFTGELMKFLAEAGRKCVRVNIETDVEKKRLKTLLDPAEDCLLVIGGDGTVLRAAHLVLGTGVPILGINLGTLGYLAEVERSNWREMMSMFLSGDYEIEPRMMLEGRRLNKGGKVEDEAVLHALNEVVIARSGAIRVLNLNVFVDGQLLNNLNADGIIVSTATGSTAYNMSAGGPLVEPKARLILLTPICAHTLNTRSVVLSKDDTLLIEMACSERNEGMLASAAFDGGSSLELRYGDCIEIRRSEKVTNLVKLTKRSFLSTLHRKLSS